MANKWVIGLAAIWAACYALAFIQPWLMPAGGDPLTSGLDNAFTWVLWQMMAAIVAVGALAARLVNKDTVTGPARWMGFVPIALSGLTWMAVITWTVVAASGSME